MHSGQLLTHAGGNKEAAGNMLSPITSTQASVQPSASVRISTLDMPKKQIREGRNAVLRAQQRLDRVERTGATFLMSDLNLAMTLTRIATDAAKNSAKRKRNQANARHAYDAVFRISRQALLTDGERQNIDARLAKLRSALEQLGEVFA